MTTDQDPRHDNAHRTEAATPERSDASAASSASSTPASAFDAAPPAPAGGWTRRRWLGVLGAGGMAASGTALIVGVSWPLLTRRPAGSPERFEPNEFLRITPDGRITIVCGQAEMGQGVLTAFAMLVADELDADWSQVRAEHAPADPVYANPLQGAQITGGSSAIRGHWQALRRAGAAAREMLVRAAAARWQVDPARCRTVEGQVIHPDGRQGLRYGELVADASALDIPAHPRFKRPAQQTFVGRPMPRLDTPSKVDGSARFGLDVRLPGQWVAVVERAPWPDAVAQGLDLDAAHRLPGVHAVVVLPQGVAVVARGFWAAQQARRQLHITWAAHPKAEEGAARSGPSWSTETFRTLLHTAAMGDGLPVFVRGLPDELYAQSLPARRLEVLYEVPWLAHACMEPMNCTAWVRETQAEVWTGTQQPGAVQRLAARLCGLPRSQVQVHNLLLGGGFGRRYGTDMVEDAVRLSMHLKAPVQVVYSREDDLRAGHYRPAAVGRLSASLTRDGLPDVLMATVSVPSVHAAFEGRTQDLRQADKPALQGLSSVPYGIGHLRIAHAPCEPGPKAGFWRSVAHSHNLFFLESFIDELAHAADQDPMHYRHRLLDAQPRLRAVLQRAAVAASWGRAAPGRHQGIAVASCYGSHIALVAEVTLSDDGMLRVPRIVAALDCGWVVNPDTVRAQVEGAIVFGLSAALYGRIDFDRGQVVQGNFDSYPVLRLAETPAIEVHLIDSTEPPGGVGEPGTPLVAPALANAIHAASQRRLRRLPLLVEGKLAGVA